MYPKLSQLLDKGKKTKIRNKTKQKKQKKNKTKVKVKRLKQCMPNKRNVR